MKTHILKTLKVIIWRLKVITFQGIKKKGIGFQVRVSIGLGFSMGSRQCNLSMASPTPPLVGASQRSFPFFYKRGPTWPHQFTALHASVLFLLLHFNVILHASLMFLHMLHCSCLCFDVAPPHASLHCSFLCFVAPPIS